MTVKSMEKLENSKVALIIEVDSAAFDAAVNKIYHKQKGRISVPGFRKGKAPRKVIEGMYGAGVFYEDAVEEIYPDALDAAVKEKELEVVAYPDVEIMEMGKEGLVFKATLTTKPEATLGEYKGLKAEKPDTTVTEHDLEHELEPFVRRATRIVEVDRKAKNGDTAVIDFEGFLDGVPFDGGQAEGYNLDLGSGSFVPGFEEQIIGLKAGDEKDIDITFPEEYTPDLAGKAVVFKVKVHSIKEHQTPELDDEFAKDVSEFDTLAELKKDLSDKLAAKRETDAKNTYESALMDQVTENMTVEVPDAMVEYEADRLMRNFSQRIEQQGMRLEDYLGMMGMSVDAFREDAKRTALRRIKNDLALEAIMDAEKITVSEQEMDEEYAKLAEEYKMEQDKVKEIVPAAEIEKDVKYRKAANIVYDSAKNEKPKAKKPAKKTEADGEEKKPAAKKTAKKAEGEVAAKKPAAKKPAAKKTTKKSED